MAKVTVYKVCAYNIATDEIVISRRMATSKGAERMGTKIMSATGVEIDATLLEPGEEWTARDFNPNVAVGFQRQVP